MCNHDQFPDNSTTLNCPEVTAGTVKDLAEVIFYAILGSDGAALKGPICTAVNLLKDLCGHLENQVEVVLLENVHLKNK